MGRHRSDAKAAAQTRLQLILDPLPHNRSGLQRCKIKRFIIADVPFGIDRHTAFGLLFGLESTAFSYCGGEDRSYLG